MTREREIRVKRIAAKAGKVSLTTLQNDLQDWRHKIESVCEMYPFDKKTQCLLAFLITLSLLASVPLSICSFVLLDENRLLTLASSCLEVAVGFYGFLLASYAFFMEAVAGTVGQDSSLDDLLCKLRSGYQRWLLFLGVTSAVIVVVGLASISFGVLAALPMWIRNWLVNALVLLTVTLMVECLVFVHCMSDPQSVTRLANDLLDEYQGSEHTEGGMSLSEFLAKYNELESFLVCLSDLPVAGRGRRFPTMRDAVAVLYERGQLSTEERDELDRLRQYRNLLVHGTDVSLDQDMAMALSHQFENYTEQRFVDDSSTKTRV